MYKKYDNKILLVDDDTKNLQVAMNILKNYNVIYAQNGEKAFELLEKNNFDLTLAASLKNYKIPYGICEIENGGSLIKINEKPEYKLKTNVACNYLEYY